MSKKITKAKAKKWADKFKKDGRGSRSVMFPKTDLIELLNQMDCEGLRIYNAYDDDKSQYTMFLVGTKADGTNLLPDDSAASSPPYSIWNDGAACPTNCPPNDL